jgi:hypothetical protein
VISGFHHEVAENCNLLGYYTASSDNFLPTFWDNPSVPSSRFKNPKESLLPMYGLYTGMSVGGEKSQQCDFSQ